MAHADALSRVKHVGVVSGLDIDFQLRVAQSRDLEICRLREKLETAESNEYEHFFLFSHFFLYSHYYFIFLA